MTASPLLSAERDTGLRRIRTSYTNPTIPGSTSPYYPLSRNPSLTLLTSGSVPPTPSSSSFPPFSSDLSRFPSESLHSFSFAHQTSDTLQSRQNALKRSIDFMQQRVGGAVTSPRMATAHARLAGDEEMVGMLEALHRASMKQDGLAMGLGIEGLSLGPLTGPALVGKDNVFESSFASNGAERLQEASTVASPDTLQPAPSPPLIDADPQPLTRVTTTTDHFLGLPPQRPMKRTYTDIPSYTRQQRLSEAALAQPYSLTTSSRPAAPARTSTLAERVPHGTRTQQAHQAIFTTEGSSPWTITAANDLACLVFGVTRAEVRKLGIMEVIREERRPWLESKLRSQELGSSRPKATPSQRSSPSSSGLASMGSGVTAKLLSKPRSPYQSRRSKTENGTLSPPSSASPSPNSSASTQFNHNPTKSRGVLLCGDVVPIQKMNGATGSASLWVKEKSGGLIWVLEEIAEDVAFITVDEIGSVVRGKGDVEAIWGLERVRKGMDVQKLIPHFPKLRGTNTGALDFEAIEQLRRFTARTSNSISIPVTIDRVEKEASASRETEVFRVSSFPHIAGIMVVNPSTLRVTSSNTVFSAALFGQSAPNGLLITDMLPDFAKILRIMTDEDQIRLVDGIVIPEHSFRKARSLLALREGARDAAARVFLRPSGVGARHRDGGEVMVDIQMRVVSRARDPIYTHSEDAIAEEEGEPDTVLALWITYSRQLHAVNHGVGPVPAPSRPGTPPEQPAPPLPTNALPVVLTAEDDPALSLLTQRLAEAKDAPATEPYEHPSPAMLAAGCTVVAKKCIDDFLVLEDMGAGAYGQVKLARYKRSPLASKQVIKFVTKKRILVDTWHRDRRLGTVPLEIHVLDYLRRLSGEANVHPNIITMTDFFEDDVNYYIEMPPHGLPGMDLFDYIELRVTMEESECRKIFAQVASAIGWLHGGNVGVVHRDVKDENVVLDGEGRVKLVDFGSAAYIKSGPFDVFVGTIGTFTFTVPSPPVFSLTNECT